MTTDQASLIKAIYIANHTDEELLRIIGEKQAQAWECHANGAYGSAQDQMKMASIARQCLEARHWPRQDPPGLDDYDKAKRAADRENDRARDSKT